MTLTEYILRYLSMTNDTLCTFLFVCLAFFLNRRFSGFANFIFLFRPSDSFYYRFLICFFRKYLLRQGFKNISQQYLTIYKNNVRYRVFSILHVIGIFTVTVTNIYQKMISIFLTSKSSLFVELFS